MNGFWRDSALIIPTVPVTANATGVLTSDNTNVSDGDTVTIGSKVYRFKTVIAQINDINIGNTADASLTNLANAINGAGVPGTDYFTGTVKDTNVTSSAVAAHALTLTAINPGFGGNTIATTKSAAHLSWGQATLFGGVGGKLQNVTVNVNGAGGLTLTTDPIQIGQYTEILNFLNSIAHSGTNPTLDCKMQLTDDASMNTPVTPVWIDSGDAFAQVTTTDSMTIKKATANFGKWIRFIIALTGTNPKYTFSLTAAVKA